MKARSREINIVSMSALDMFCSALGAFMFLALLFSAFVPNLGPSSEEAARLRQALRESEQTLERAQAERDAAVTRIEAQAVEIAIVIDTTASMTGPIEGLKSQIRDFAQVVSRLAGDARIAIVEYKDNDACPQMQSVRTLPLTPVDRTGVARIQAFADSLRPGTPCDNNAPEEDVADAIRTALRLGWSRPAAQRYIVVIGDNPPHDQAERDQSLADARAWGGAGSHLSALLLRDIRTAGDGAAAGQFYAELARRGNGALLPPGDSFAVVLLKAITG
jgi:hypothetical protein